MSPSSRRSKAATYEYATKSIISLSFLLTAAIVPVARSKSAKVVAVPDEATTYTGRSILADVVKNDYHDDGISSLVLAGITSNGVHGTCTIVEDPFFGSTNILYQPNGSYAGADTCDYEVCVTATATDEATDCGYSTLTVTIAKELEPVFDFTNVDDDGVFDVGSNVEEEEEGVLDSVSESAPAMEEHAAAAQIMGDWSVDPIDTLIQEAMDQGKQTTFDPALANGPWENTIEFDFNYCNPSNDEVLLTLELQTDKHGEDVSWEFREVITPTLFKRFKKSEVLYKGYSYDRVDICVKNKYQYRFLIKDQFGDGLCQPVTGRKCGYYKLYLDGKEIVHGSYYGTKNSHLINVGYNPTSGLTMRDVGYIRAHNSRRKKWHETYNVSFVPLRWSPKLAEESLNWAEALLDDCDIVDIEHEPNVYEGENLAKNKGAEYDQDGNPSWGQLYDPENIVRRWVDREIGWSYPDNAHLTQSLWRASKYMGCGESVKDWNGGKCRVQVCRYAKAGNCDMTRFDSTTGENWLTPMLQDVSACEPSCPPEGCY